MDNCLWILCTSPTKFWAYSTSNILKFIIQHKNHGTPHINPTKALREQRSKAKVQPPRELRRWCHHSPGHPWRPGRGWTTIFGALKSEHDGRDEALYCSHLGCLPSQDIPLCYLCLDCPSLAWLLITINLSIFILYDPLVSPKKS